MKTLMAFLVLLLLLVASSLAEDKGKNSGARAYDAFPEPWRGRLLSDWEKDRDGLQKRFDELSAPEAKRAWQKKLETAKKSLAYAKTYRDKDKVGIARLAKEVESLEKNPPDKDAAAAKQALEVVMRNQPPYIRSLSCEFDQWKVGDYGTCAIHAEVFQVLDRTSMLLFRKGQSMPRLPSGRPAQSMDAVAAGSAEAARIAAEFRERNRAAFEAMRAPKDAWVMFRQFDTSGLVDGKTYSSTIAVVVTGTTTYETAKGTKTVLTVEPLSPEALQKSATVPQASVQVKNPSDDSTPSQGLDPLKEYIKWLRGSKANLERRIRETKDARGRRSLEASLKWTNDTLASEEKKLSLLETKKLDTADSLKEDIKWIRDAVQQDESNLKKADNEGDRRRFGDIVRMYKELLETKGKRLTELEKGMAEKK